MANSGVTQTATFLSLPCEIRHQIYRHLFSPPPTYMVRAESYIAGALEFYGVKCSSIDFNKNIMFTSKALYAETLPILCYNMDLHITFREQQPIQPDLEEHFSQHMRRHVRNITFHLHAAGHMGRPPKAPFRFQLFPGLKQFVFRKPFKISIDLLYDSSPNRTKSRADYDRLDHSAKLEVWTKTGLLEARPIIGIVGRYGSGGWVSVLVQPEIFGQDGMGRSELGAMEDCEVFIEADIMLFAMSWNGERWLPECIDTLTITVDTQSKTVSNVRFLDKSERERRILEAGGLF